MSIDAENSHFAHNLEQWGQRIALTSDKGETISYAQLALMADAFGEDLQRVSGATRGLLLLEMHNSIAAVVAYVGALRAHWPVILTADIAQAGAQELITRFCPDLTWSPAAGLCRSLPPSELPLHNDLGVLLSTSGSTGSAKLVRLSRSNIHENARSIAQYLELDQTRVAATTLPMHYSYGLSVLNSFLLAGGRVVLTEISVIDAGFLPLLERESVTDLAGVPYTYELFERLHFRDNPPASLKAMTQAGGRLAPGIVAQYADFAAARSLQFFVMYGQTEATARMAYLPPHLAGSNSDCIGLPIPRGRFELVTEDGLLIEQPGIPGELIYHGPNVMMGYALERKDLARGSELKCLETGDIAELTETGLYRIAGRLSRFSKIAGLRIGFDEIEGILRQAGMPTVVSGTDETLLLAVREGAPETARQMVADSLCLPAGAIFAWHLPELPVLPSGKTDYTTVKQHGLSLAAKARQKQSQATGQALRIAELYAREMNRALPDETESFSGLGGDSLAYVSISVGIEELLGHAPEGWETMAIRELQAMADTHQSTSTGKRAHLTLKPDILLRLLAISLVIIGHGAPEQTEGYLRGGAGLLLMLAGYGMALIHFPQLMNGSILPMIRSTALRLVVPYMLMVTLLLAVSPAAKSVSWYLLGSTFVIDSSARGPLFSYWFMESLFHCMLLTCALFTLPKFRAWMRADPFVTAIGLVALATLFRWAGAAWWPNGGSGLNLTVDAWAWIFFLGVAAFHAGAPWQKALVVMLALGLGMEHYGDLAQAERT